MSVTEQVNSALSSSTTKIIATTLMVFIGINLLRQLWGSITARLNDDRKLANFEKMRMNPRHWFFGHVAMLQPHNIITRFADEASKAVTGLNRVWFGPFRCYLAVLSPDTVKTILGTAEPKDDFSYGFIKPWIGDGLLTSSGKKWQRNRKLLTPAFHFEVLRPYTKIFNDSALTLVEKWKQAGQGKQISREMSKDVSLFTLDSLLKCIFSIESNCQNEGVTHPYIKSIYAISELVMKRVYNVFHHNDLVYYFSIDGWRWRRAVNGAHTFARNVIAKRKKEAIDNDGLRKTRRYVDFLDILIRAKDDQGKGLSDREIEDEVDTFMFEGHDTTSSGISWMLYNMARHPEYQKKCREEVDAVFSSKEGDRLEWDDLSKLPYLTMCLKESLRLHSPVPIINRRIERPLQFGEQVAPAGTEFTVQIGSMHLNKQAWDNPEVYDPERFSPENSRERHSHAYVPFSAGPRNCIGQNFAMNEMKVITAQVLRHFHLKVDESVPVERYLSLVLRAKNGIHLLLTPREL